MLRAVLRGLTWYTIGVVLITSRVTYVLMSR